MATWQVSIHCWCTYACRIINYAQSLLVVRPLPLVTNISYFWPITRIDYWVRRCTEYNLCIFRALRPSKYCKNYTVIVLPVALDFLDQINLQTLLPFQIANAFNKSTTTRNRQVTDMNCQSFPVDHQIKGQGKSSQKSEKQCALKRISLRVVLLQLRLHMR